MNTIEFETAKAEAFAGRMLTILNSGALAVMVSIGHRTELFDTLATLPPVTSDELADAGFRAVEVRQLPQDFLNTYYIARV